MEGISDIISTILIIIAAILFLIGAVSLIEYGVSLGALEKFGCKEVENKYYRYIDENTIVETTESNSDFYNITCKQEALE